MKIIPGDDLLGARIEEIDLSALIAPADQDAIVQALGRYGVVSFPGQTLEAADLKRFSSNFGSTR